MARKEKSKCTISCRDCGRNISQEQWQHHLLSRGHNNARRIKILISEAPCLSLAAIGERVGLTSERVRQIVDAMHLDVETGWDRREVCAVRRNVKAFEESDCIAKDVADKCRELGYSVEFIPLADGKISQYRLRVNDRLCVIKQLSRGHTYNNTTRTYLRMAAPSGVCDFVIARSPEGDWWIFPCNVYGSGLSFTSEVSAYYKNPVGRAKRGKYLKFREAWQLLSSQADHAAPEPMAVMQEREESA